MLALRLLQEAASKERRKRRARVKGEGRRLVRVPGKTIGMNEKLPVNNGSQTKDTDIHDLPRRAQS